MESKSVLKRLAVQRSEPGEGAPQRVALQKVAADALQVQDAVNLSGVVRSFAQATEVLWAEAREQGKGTEFVNHHPVSRLFAEAIACLAGGGSGDFASYHAAYAECVRLSKGA